MERETIRAFRSPYQPAEWELLSFSWDPVSGVSRFLHRNRNSGEFRRTEAEQRKYHTDSFARHWEAL